MNADDRPNADARSLLTITVAVVVAAAVALAGSSGGARLAGIPVMIWCSVLAFAINWVAYVPSWLTRSERYYDLTGTITYLGVIGFGIVAVDRYDTRSLLLAGLVALWSLRLGSFLFARILDTGSDARFDRIKTDPLRLLATWTLQGLWVNLTLAAALGAITASGETTIGWVVAAGLAVWVVGFGTEAIADNQKRAFRADPANDGAFISSGLWSWSRHPNYFGEILVWIGVALVAIGNLEGWRYVTLISPLFVYVLLTRISGVPLLEKRGEQRWGTDLAYQRYVDHTPSLLPRRPPRP